MTEEANGNQQAASTENGGKPPEIDYEAKYKGGRRPFPRMGETRQGQQDSRRRTATAQGGPTVKPKRQISTSKSLKPRTLPTRRKNSRTNGRRGSQREPAPSLLPRLHHSKKCKPTARRSPTTSPKTKPKVHASSESNQPPAPSDTSGDWLRDQFLKQKRK